MQIQIRTDNHLKNSVDFSERLQAVLERRLAKFNQHITRAVVHLSDENSKKGGSNDKRCAIEIRLEGHQPLAVTHNAGTLRDAFNGAATKIKRVVRDTLARRRAHA